MQNKDFHTFIFSTLCSNIKSASSVKRNTETVYINEHLDKETKATPTVSGREEEAEEMEEKASHTTTQQALELEKESNKGTSTESEFRGAVLLLNLR